LDEAVLINDQVVITGRIIEKINNSTYEAIEGSYTNCNTGLVEGPEAAECSYSWKIFGKEIYITFEEYAHIKDAIIYMQDLPAIYSPYFVFPVKSKRQSGILRFRIADRAHLGTSYTLPYFWAIAPWQDLEFIPTYYDEVGYHLGFKYRYKYSAQTQGFLNFHFMERLFNSDPDTPEATTNKSKVLGFLGEWSIYGKNRVDLGNRMHSRQELWLVSDPFYTKDYGADMANREDPGLRSLISFTSPSDHLLFTAKAEYFQNILRTNDRGVDRGPVMQLPTLTFSQTDVPVLGRLFSYEFDAIFSNFIRPEKGFDNVPNPVDRDLKDHSDTDQGYDSNDYIRTGRRLHLEPRIILNTPMPDGFQLQPVLRGGTLLYQLDFPNASIPHQEFIDVEIPFSMYTSKTYNPGWSGFEKINHVFQPRLVYSKSLLRRSTDHNFFFKDTVQNISNPRFDIVDQLTPVEFVRLELINRFRRKSGEHIHRFFRLELSTQINFKTSPTDPRFEKKNGPLELLAEFDYNRWTAQTEVIWQREKTERVITGQMIHEYSLSGDIAYKVNDFDFIRLGTRRNIKADDTKTEESVRFSAGKTLPWFFDITGDAEYNLKKGLLVHYALGFHFYSKPRSCWDVFVKVGQSAFADLFFSFDYSFSFGNPGDAL